MNMCFIYFDEIPLKDNNKFTLNFFNQDMIQKISFNKITNYYIASLDCNLILEEHIKRNQKKKLKNFLKLVGFYLKKVMRINLILDG